MVVCSDVDVIVVVVVGVVVDVVVGGVVGVVDVVTGDVVGVVTSGDSATETMYKMLFSPTATILSLPIFSSLSICSGSRGSVHELVVHNTELPSRACPFNK